jgi:endoplasmic reticulum chaperone BiP
MMTKDNELLGNFELSGIQAAPRGKPKIEVTFNVDVNCILVISAMDKDSGKSNSVTIQRDKFIKTKEEIEKMVNEAKKFEEEDKILKKKLIQRIISGK